MIEKLLPRAFHYYINLPITGKIADDFTNFLLTSGYAKSTVKVKIKHIRRIDNGFRATKFYPFMIWMYRCSIIGGF